ncbi:MAG: hypothetical protein AB1411_12600 [Nitrospirota bacterium]
MVVQTGCAGWPWLGERELREATAGQLTQLLKERETAVQTMKGLFRAQIKGPGIPFSQRVEGAMFYRRPDLLRLQGFNQVGGALFDFVLTEDRYLLKVPALGQVLSGRRNDLGRLGKLGQPFRLTLLAVSGVVGTASVEEGQTVSLAEDEDRYRLDVLSAGSGTPFRRLWFDRRTLQVVQEDWLKSDGTVKATVRFEDFRQIEGPAKAVSASEPATAAVGPLLKPFKVVTEDGQSGGSLKLTFHEIVPNPDLTPEELGVGVALGWEEPETGSLAPMVRGEPLAERGRVGP